MKLFLLILCLLFTGCVKEDDEQYEYRDMETATKMCANAGLIHYKKTTYRSSQNSMKEYNVELIAECGNGDTIVRIQTRTRTRG